MNMEAALGIDEAPFRRRNLPSDMDDLAFGTQPAGR